MRVLKSDKNRIFLLGAAIGALVFLFIYGLSFLNPFKDSFVANGYLERDISQHYAGWLLFRSSPWQLPFGIGQNIAYPYGASVSFTDSVPLFALFFKLIGAFLPATFQYFGIFTFISFILQGGFAALLARLFDKKLIIPALTALLFVTFPVFLERAARHTALTAQWLILASLYYYFKSTDKTGLKKYVTFLVINALAVSIHPYFLPFTFAIMLAAIIRDSIITKKPLIPFISLFISLALTVAEAFLLGMFYGGGGLSEGYGYFSMNLNAYFNPKSLGFENWSVIMPVRAQTPGQYDGFNYLGLGVILSIAAILTWLILNRKTLIGLLKQHLPLIAVTACLTIFAVSNAVTFGGATLFELPLPRGLISLFSTFRASGRFGWLLGYLTALGGIYCLSRLIKEKYCVYAASALLAVQLLDISGAVLQKQRYFYTNGRTEPAHRTEQTLKSEFWNDNAFKYYLSLETDAVPTAVDVAVNAGKLGKSINIHFAAREDRQKNEDFMLTLNAELKAGKAREDVLYFVKNPTHYYGLQKSGQAVMADIDGRFVLISAKRKEMLFDFGIESLPLTSLYAESYDEPPYANGIYNELNVIMVYPPQYMREEMLNARKISNGELTAEISKITAEGDMLYIFLNGANAEDFAYPRAFWIEE